MEPKVKNRLLVSMVKSPELEPPGRKGPPTPVREPVLAVGSAAANAGSQVEPEPPSAMETMGAVAMSPVLKATAPSLKVSKVPLPKPKRRGAKLTPLAGDGSGSSQTECDEAHEFSLSLRMGFVAAYSGAPGVLLCHIGATGLRPMSG
jgi:hypothetical protein